jgi:hypothetical protein
MGKKMIVWPRVFHVSQAWTGLGRENFHFVSDC